MSAAALAAVLVTAVLVAALAFYLIWIVLILHRLVDTLGKVLFGVGAIAHRLEPVGPVLPDVNADLEGVAVAMEALADEVAPTSGKAEVAS
jgi:hypothetical protein